MNKKIFLLIIIWQCFFVWSDYALAFGIKLLPPEGNSIYFGAFPDFGGDEEDISKQKIDDFEALAQKNIMWAPFHSIGIEAWFIHKIKFISSMMKV